MSHARQQIREAVAAILRANPVTWTTVTETRIASSMQIWPYLMVFAESDQSQPATVDSPYVYSREMTLTVAGMLRLDGTGDTQTIEDQMDAVAAEIETKLTQSALYAALPGVQSLSLASTIMQVIQEIDGVDHAEVITSWRIGYATLEGSPDSLM